MLPDTLPIQPRRNGSISFEALLVLPLLLLVIGAAIQFGLIVYAEQRLAEAAARASRVAATGGTRADIDKVLLIVLGNNLARSATVLTNDSLPGGDREDDGDDNRDDRRNGTSALNSGDLLLIRIEIPASAAAPNILGWIGVSLYEQKLVGQSVVMKE